MSRHRMRRVTVTLLIIACSSVLTLSSGELEVVHQWKDIDFFYPNGVIKWWNLATGAYIPGNAFPLDVDYNPLDANKRLFVTVPRFLPGVPATLATVMDTKNDVAILQPYPSWDWHLQGDCSGITSVLRTKIDSCGNIWVLDSGVVDVLGPKMKRICQPKILVFNTETDTLLWSYRFPDRSLATSSLLATIALDSPASCDETFAYIADISGYGLIVYDSAKRKSWRVNSNLFYPYPTEGHFNINGVEFDLMDGVISVVVSHKKKTLYFHSMASNVESWISTDVLKNETNFQNGNRVYEQFRVSEGTRGGQSGPSAIDGKGNTIFFSVFPENSLYCWNPSLPYKKENFVQVYQNDTTFQFPSGLKMITDRIGRDWLYALTSRFQNVITRTIDRNELNYRILRAPVEVLVKGTSCT